MSQVVLADKDGLPLGFLSWLIASVGRTLLAGEAAMLLGIEFRLSPSLTQVVTVTEV